MRFINSGDRNKAIKIKKLFLFLGLGLFILSCLSCAKVDELKQSEGYIRKSEVYYNLAIKGYRELIARAKDPSKLYFKLGEIYFNRGQFEKSIEAFKHSNEVNASKFIAIAYYNMGNFTDALEIFNRQKTGDDEFKYYHGLTCEKLNLFDQALAIYEEIDNKQFITKAKIRIDIIEKKVGLKRIQDIDPIINKIIADSPGQKAYPQAGALILLADENTEVTKEKAEISSLHYLIKVLNERGKENFAEAAIEYDSTFEKVELEYARTIKPDGTVVDVGSRHIRDVSKYLNFPLYSNARIYIISFPEVAIGSSLEYKFKIKRNQLINKKDFVLDYLLQSAEPILKADFSVTLPKENKLNIKFINKKYNDFGASLEPVVEDSLEKRVYRWHFKKIPQIIPEANMPPDAEINPAILLSTFKSWDEFYGWWWNLAKDKMIPDNAIRDKVKALVQGKSYNLARAREIYNFCAKDIRYVAVEYGQAGFKPHSASDIFMNKYGDCKDQAILLVTMLREAGFKAYPVLIGTKQHFNLNPDFPTSSFNHCIAALFLEGRIIFLDPTADTCSYDDLPAQDQGRKVLIIKDNGFSIEETPLYPAEHNLVRQETKIKVNADESIIAKKSNFTYGVYDQAQRRWLLYTQPDLIKDTLNNVIQGITIGAKLEKYNIENLDNLNKPVVLVYNFRGPEYFTIAGPLRIMSQLAAIDTGLVSKPQRKYPLELDLLDCRENILELEVPQGLLLKSMPDSINEDSVWFTFKVEYSYKNNKLFFKQKIETKKEEITQEEYLEFKNFVEKIARSIKQRVVFEQRD